MSSSADSYVHRLEHVVRALDMDARGRLSVTGLLLVLQEAAGESAHALGFPVERLLRDGVSWVLARFRLEMQAWPLWRETIRVETWPAGADGARAYREFRVFDGAGAPIGRATSLWMVIDLATRRPAPIPSYVRLPGLPDMTGIRPAELRALEAPEAADAEATFRVRWSDLDVNDHANNVCYVEWALETVPPELRASAFPSSLAIDFRAETRLGDTIVATRRALADGAFAHRITHAADGREVAALTTRWS